MAGEINFGAVNHNAVYDGITQTNALLQNFAQQRAGKLIASGDRAGAVKTLQNDGQVDAGFKLEDHFHAEDARVKTLDDAKKAESAKMVLDVAKALDEVRLAHGDGAVAPAFEQLAPIFKSRGATDEELGMYRQQLATNPGTFLSGIAGHAADTLKRYTLTPGSALVDNQGKQLASQPFAPQVHTVSPGQSLIQTPGTGGAPAAPDGSAPVSPDPGATPPDAAAAAPEAPTLSETSAQDFIKRAFPQAVVTSGYRTPEHNAEVKGVPNSYHIRNGGEAVDFVKPHGVQLADIRSEIQSRGLPIKELIDEGTHVHWAWGDTKAKYNANAPEAPPAHGQEQVPTPSPTGAGIVLASVPAKPAPNWRDLTPAEIASRGYAAGTVGQVGPGGSVRITQQPQKNTGGAGGPGQPKLSQADGAYLRGLREAADKGQNAVGLIDEFVDLNKQVPTGGMMALPGAADARAAFDPKVRRMLAIQSQLTPMMRNGLPGSASDRDVAMFKAATVGFGGPLEANQMTQKAVHAMADRMGDYVAFKESYAQTHGGLLGAQELWNHYVHDEPLYLSGQDGGVVVRKVTPWRQYFKDETGPGAAKPAGAPRVRKWTPDKGLEP